LLGGNPLLPPITPGATAIQAGDDRAPWLLLKPSLGVSVGFDDNPRQIPNRQADAVTFLTPSMIVSVDSPRVQGLLTSSFDFRKYVRATNQDQLSANGAGYAFATIAPEHLYLDGRGSIFQVSPVGGAGFANPTLGTLIQPQTVFGDRLNQIDVRLSKRIALGNARRLAINADLYNLTNSNWIIGYSANYGPNFLRPTQVLSPRMFKIGAQFDF